MGDSDDNGVQSSSRSDGTLSSLIQRMFRRDGFSGVPQDEPKQRKVN
jgi:hypothetical protein